MSGKGRPVTKSERAALEQCFRDGVTANWAADRCGVSGTTALKYYAAFAALGIKQGARKRRPNPSNFPNRSKAPTYTGSDWIGEAATRCPTFSATTKN